MKCLILLALLGLALAGPILSNSQEDVRILSDGSVVISNGLGTRIYIQKATETKGNLEIIIKNRSGLNRVIEISSPTQVVKNVIKNSQNIEVTANIVPKVIDDKKSKSKGPIVNGDVQLKTLQTIVREYQGILDTTTYVDLLNQVSAAVTDGQLNQAILDAFRAVNQSSDQNQEDTTQEESVVTQDHPSQSTEDPADFWSKLHYILPQNFGQNPVVQPNAIGQNPAVWSQSWNQPPLTFGAQNSYIKFGPGGPFGPFGPFSPYAPFWWNPNATLPPTNPWTASNPWLQSNPWVAGNPWVVPPQSSAASGVADQTSVDDSSTSFGGQNSFALKFPGGPAPWWLATSPIDAQLKEAVKYQKNALKNLQQLQALKYAQSTATAGDSSQPTIDYDSAIQSAQEVLEYAQKNVADLTVQKQQQQAALLQQYAAAAAGIQPPVAGQQPGAGQFPASQVQAPVNQQAFFVNEKPKPTEPTEQPNPEAVNPFISLKVKPFPPTKATKPPKTVSEAPEIAQTKIAAVIQQRIQAIQDQWTQQNLVNQQLLQQQAQVAQQIKQLQDQLQLVRAQGGSLELQNQIQLAQQDLSARQALLIQQQLNQQAVTNSLQAQLSLLNDQLKTVPNANVPEGVSTWPEMLGIQKGSKVPKGSGVARVPLQGGLQSFYPTF